MLLVDPTLCLLPLQGIYTLHVFMQGVCTSYACMHTSIIQRAAD
ncbi:hypothetical protein GBAR_LOCUS6662, partial [Geodia barretti]